MSDINSFLKCKILSYRDKLDFPSGNTQTGVVAAFEVSIDM